MSRELFTENLCGFWQPLKDGWGGGGFAGLNSAGSRALLSITGRGRVSAANFLPLPRGAACVLRLRLGGVVLITDAKNDRAARGYTEYGGAPLADKPLTLVMSLATFAAGLKGAGKLLFSTRERELLWGGSGVSKLGTNRPEFTKRSLRGLMSASPWSRQARFQSASGK